MSQPNCVLRTHHLCDGDQVVDYRRAPGPTLNCYCDSIDYCVGHRLDALVDVARTDRARTVARSAELQRLTERSQRLTGAPTDVPPF